jgi:hypothetical protein
VLAGEMAVAYFQFHFPQGFWPVMNNGVPAALSCFVWLFFSAAGAGPWSVDAWLKSRKEKTPRVLRPARRPLEVEHGHGGRLLS